MLALIRNARRFVGASVSYPMSYRFHDFTRDALGDIIGTGVERSRTVFGRVRLVEQEPGAGGAVPARSYELCINARCGFTPQPGARVVPSAGPFKDETFTIGGQAPVMDAQGANWIMAAVHG